MKKIQAICFSKIYKKLKNHKKFVISKKKRGNFQLLCEIHQKKLYFMKIPT